MNRIGMVVPAAFLAVVLLACGCAEQLEDEEEETPPFQRFPSTSDVLASPLLSRWLPPDLSAEGERTKYHVVVGPWSGGPYQIRSMLRTKGTGLNIEGAFFVRDKEVPFSVPSEDWADYLILAVETNSGALEILAIRTTLYDFWIDD
jgi:hypothetical protein